MGEVMERGGLAHQSNASLIVAAVWVGERMIRKQRESGGKEGGREGNKGQLFHKGTG